MSTIVTRSGKGSPLTHTEVDSNFTNLNTDKIQVTGSPSTNQSLKWDGSAWIPFTPTEGTVTSVTGTSPVASTGGATPAISLATAYGDTLNPYGSKTANFVLAAPNSSAGVPTFRAIVAADIPTLNQNTTGTASNVTGTVAIANGGTGLTTLTANNVILGNGASTPSFVAPGASGNVLTSNGTTWTSAAASGGASTVSYPQNIQSANYTLVLSDAGKQIYHPASDANTRTYTIPSNSSVAFTIGTVVLFAAENNGNNIKVAINSDTLITTDGITGTKLVPSGNILTCIKTTATKWVCYLATDTLTSVEQVALAHDTTPFISVYQWNEFGFSSRYTNPVTLPTGSAQGVAFSLNNSAIAVAHATSPFITAYPWSSSGFGIKYSNPATLPSENGRGVAFSPSGNDIAVAHSTTPFVTAYPWSGSGFGTKYANPATLPAGNGVGVAFSPSGNDIAVIHATPPFVTAYPWSGSGFGTKYTDPATLPAGGTLGITFSPSGNDIAVAHVDTPFITAYPWSGSGFGTKYTNPATLPAGLGRTVAFSPSGNDIAVSHDTTPFISVYPWSGSGFGAKYTNPATLPSGNGRGVAFSPSGNNIVVGSNTTPFVFAYPWSGSGFGTKYANPATLPVGSVLGVAFNSF